MKIAIGSDIKGYELKIRICEKFKETGYEYIDFGGYSPEDDVLYPISAQKLCRSILSGETERGIFFCGTGIGAVIACNKIPGIRAATVHDMQCAHQCVEHNHVQVMAIGEKCVGEWLAWDLIRVFLEAKPEKNERRRAILSELYKMDGTPLDF